jgi:hypothetical protein
MTDADWITICAGRLRELIEDEGVTREHLRVLATALRDEPRYAELEPEAAAELYVRSEA